MNDVFIIAEVGQSHDGSLGFAHSYIDALAKIGVDAVKFQTHIAEAESSEHENFRIQFSYEDNTRYDYWKRMEFNLSQWKGLKDHCETLGLKFISSPFSIAAVDLLESIGVEYYKIGSGEVNNLLMLDKIANTQKPIIVSSGLSDFDELDKTIDFLNQYKSRFSLMQCTSSYPTIPSNWGLNIISELKERYDVPIGFSDHSGNIFSCMAATALGASLLEFHIVFSKEQFGPDSSSSITIENAKVMVQGVREISKALNSPIIKNENDSLKNMKKLFEKSLAVNKNLKQGHLIVKGDLESKKPAGKGIPAHKYKNIIGKRLINNLDKWSFINEKDIENG